MEGREETPNENGENECPTQNEEGKGEQEEEGGTDEEMVFNEGMEDWNRFISGGRALGEAEEGEVVTEWKPGEPVTPQHVLWLNSYAQGESAILPVVNVPQNMKYSCHDVFHAVKPCFEVSGSSSISCEYIVCCIWGRENMAERGLDTEVVLLKMKG